MTSLPLDFMKRSMSDIMLDNREYGSKVIGEVTLDQVYGGARGIKSLVWEVSGQFTEQLAPMINAELCR
jgi:hypothetical protein